MNLIDRIRRQTENFDQVILTNEDAKKLLSVLREYEAATAHISLRVSRQDCCKFAALNGYRRRHLKEVARNARSQVQEILSK